MMQRPLFLPLLALLILSLGCATTPPAKDYTAFRSANPRSILVLPVVNNTQSVEAPALFLSTLPIPVAEKGYYVFPVNMVKRVLEDEGLADPNLLHGAEPARLCNLFGSDAVLYVTIEAWTAQYMVITTQVTVEFDYVMKDGKTGDTIWKEHKKVVYAPRTSGSAHSSLIADRTCRSSSRRYLAGSTWPFGRRPPPTLRGGRHGQRIPHVSRPEDRLGQGTLHTPV